MSHRQPRVQMVSRYTLADRWYEKYYCMDCSKFRSERCDQPDQASRQVLAQACRYFSFAPTFIREKNCPICHQPGSLHPKQIPKGDKTYTYWYMEHYDPKKKSHMRWCYIGSKLPPLLQKQLERRQERK